MAQGFVESIRQSTYTGVDAKLEKALDGFERA